MAQRRTSAYTDSRYAKSPVRYAATLYGFYIALYLAVAGVAQVGHLLSSALAASAMASTPQVSDPVDAASLWSDDRGECVPPRTVISSTSISD